MYNELCQGRCDRGQSDDPVSRNNLQTVDYKIHTANNERLLENHVAYKMPALTFPTRNSVVGVSR